MMSQHEIARQWLQQAHQALKAGDKHAARRWAEQAARTAPTWEDVWLMMAAVSPPQESIEHLQRALHINPGSERARKGMEWALRRLKTVSAPKDEPPKTTVLPQAAAPPGRPLAFAAAKQDASVGERTQPTRAVPSPIEAKPAPASSHPRQTISRPKHAPARPAQKVSYQFLLPLLAFLLCAVIGGVIWWSATPAAAFFRSEAGGPAWAQMDIATHTPTLSSTPGASATWTASASPTQTGTPTLTRTLSPSPSPTASLTPLPSATPSATPTEEPTPTPLPTDTEVPTPVIPTPAPPKVLSAGADGERWIDVDLSRQMLYAYEGDTLVRAFVVSTGTWQYPTVTGQYRIYIKYRFKDMSGPGYYLKNVPYTMFFYKGYAIHGTYWHNNFGTPMSHGCVNLTIADAEWLYNFASVGTLVNVHY
ncbi:MAG: L,D-transpeptidase family protein [Anaerolineales bacterium]|nr:L,D-transpeptidase family protein [Anaerolineales bacterium]